MLWSASLRFFGPTGPRTPLVLLASLHRRRLQRLDDGIRTRELYHDLSEEESDENREPSRHGAQQPVVRLGMIRREQAAKDAEPSRSFTLNCQEFDTRDIMFEQLRTTVLNHHMPNLEILHKEQDESRNQITHLQRAREKDTSEWAGLAKQLQDSLSS